MPEIHNRLDIQRLASQVTADDESGDLATMWADITDVSRRAFPTLEVRVDVFVKYLTDRLPLELPHRVALRQICTADLYLACACAQGDARAFNAFEDHCLRGLDRVLRALGRDASECAEIVQDIRSRVLVGDGRRRKIVDYSGRGDLRSWVRVMATRDALQRQRRTRREVSFEDDELIQQLVVAGDPAADLHHERYRQEFKRAFEDALYALPDRARTLLRHHYIDALTVDEIGSLYRVHRSTAARLVARARAAVLEATRARMMARLGVLPHELDSILRVIRSQIEITLQVLRRHRRR